MTVLWTVILTTSCLWINYHTWDGRLLAVSPLHLIAELWLLPKIAYIRSTSIFWVFSFNVKGSKACGNHVITSWFYGFDNENSQTAQWPSWVRKKPLFCRVVLWSLRIWKGVLGSPSHVNMPESLFEYLFADLFCHSISVNVLREGEKGLISPHLSNGWMCSHQCIAANSILDLQQTGRPVLISGRMWEDI